MHAPDLIRALHHSLEDERRGLAATFERTHKATHYVQRHAALVDRIIVAAHAALFEGDTKGLCLMAVGGYGRRELFPHSDVDVKIIVDEDSPLHQAQTERLLKTLWDIGLHTSHAVRMPEESIRMAQADHTIAATLLDMRFLCGDRKLFDAFEDRFEQEVRAAQAARFVQDKMNERRIRHEHFGGARHHLEPNIKEGIGALRDLHHLYWTARFVYGARDIRDMVARGVWTEEDARIFRKAQAFLWRVRIHLHLLAGRAEERLSMEWQPRLAAAFGETDENGRVLNPQVERFMRRFFRATRTVADLTRLLASVLQADMLHHSAIGQPRLQARLTGEHDFTLQDSQLMFADPKTLPTDPLLMLRIFRLSQLRDVPVHPHALHLIHRHLPQTGAALRRNPEAGALLLEMILHPSHALRTLRELNESGILPRLIPEFGQIIGQMQYDRFHSYTVDEHTLRAIGILHDIERGKPLDELPLACELTRRISHRRALFVALLCHDIAKGLGGNHEALSAEKTLRIGPQLGLSAEETDIASWLVQHQMLLSDAAQKRDLQDAKTVSDLAQQIRSPERLRLLLLLTVCDMRAVGPNVWTRFKGALLREAYHRTAAALGVGHLPAEEERIRTHKQQFEDAFPSALHKTLREKIEVLPDSFWHGCPDTLIEDAAQSLAHYWQASPACSLTWRFDTYEGATHLLVCTPPQPALLSLIAGSISAMDASIIRMRPFGLSADTALVALEIHNRRQQMFDDEKRLRKLERLLCDVLPDARHDVLAPMIAAQRKAYKQQAGSKAEPHVSIHHDASRDHTVIEIEAEDRIGFLYDIFVAMAELKLTVSAAHINTFGQRAVDVFYVRDRFGLKIVDAAALSHVRAQLSAVLSGTAESAR